MDRSEVLALQEAKREITQELQRIQKEYEKSLELLNDNPGERGNSNPSLFYVPTDIYEPYMFTPRAPRHYPSI